MSSDEPNERSRLLSVDAIRAYGARKLSRAFHHDDERSVYSNIVLEEQKLDDGAAIGERLAYNDYTTIDWMQGLVRDSYRIRAIHHAKGLRGTFFRLFDQASGWIAAAIIGALTACVAFLVDITEATVSDWKLGYCSSNLFMTREACCEGRTPLVVTLDKNLEHNCEAFHEWSKDWWSAFGIYVGFALVFGLISGSVTLLTRANLPAAMNDPDIDDDDSSKNSNKPPPTGKSMYMAAGSGIPEIKTILCGFVLPHFLDLKVLIVKAVGSVFAVATCMCLGKEGPFVHISTCVGYLVAKQFPKYRDNGRKMREMLSAACAAGLSVAFGAPIGGVLFSYEEISTYFPRKVLWRAFLCSMVAAITLKALNPTGTGKLVLFETNFGTSYQPEHYAIFVVLGIAGGVFGGLFCRLNYFWSKWFRSFSIIKSHPVFEVFLVVLATVLLQYPNPLTREPGDIVLKNLLVDCRNQATMDTWLCTQETSSHPAAVERYHWWLVHGTLTKLVLTIISFGVKVPSGIIIPSLDAGAFFGRLVGQLVPSISPGIFAMTGAAAFLAGVSRMTISLCVIMFELTGELEYVLPHMIAILVAKWVADAIGKDSVYDLSQALLGHPFLDVEHTTHIVQKQERAVSELIPPKRTMDEITVEVPSNNKIARRVLQQKSDQLRARGLMDAGLVLVQNGGLLQGYLAQSELDFGLERFQYLDDDDLQIRLLGEAQPEDHDMSHYVDRSPLTISAIAPLEYAVEMFGKLGLRHLMVTEEGTSRLVGVIIKKRLVAYLDHLKAE